MLNSQIPTRIPLPFANSGTKNFIPTASQIGITPGAASLTDGFPPLNGTPKAAGGIAPTMQDFNGILNLVTAVQQWQSAGGSFTFNSAFSTFIGGYPKGSTLISSTGDTNWLSTVDSNTTDPDSMGSVGWVSLDAYGIASVFGLTNANVTLTPAQWGKGAITLAGALTGNVQIIFPNALQQWRVINKTSGAFNVTCKTAAGTGPVIAQGAQDTLYGDGTNLTSMNTLQFGGSITPNGYQPLPSGLILQWGSVPCANSATTFANLPIAMPKSILHVMCSGYNYSGGVQAYAVVNDTIGLSQVSFNAFYASAGGVVPSLATSGQVLIKYYALGN